MKQLIEKLRQYTAGDDFRRATEQAADAIERLELEAVAATLRIENDALEIAKLLTTNSSLVHDKESDRLAYLAMRDERDTYQQAADTMAAAHKAERDGMRAEIEKLQQQKPIAYLAWHDGKPCWSDDCVCEDAIYPVHDDDDRVSMPVYLAAGVAT